MEDFENIDPKSFFKEQAKLFGEEKRESDDYQDFCKAARRVMATESGKIMMNGLAQIIQYGSSCFREEDKYNERAAAARDGAQATFREIIIAAKIGQNIKPEQDQ